MKTESKSIVESWTAWFGTAIIIATYVNEHEGFISNIVPEQYQYMLFYVFGAAAIVLRLKTNKPVTFKKKKKPPASEVLSNAINDNTKEF